MTRLLVADHIRRYPLLQATARSLAGTKVGPSVGWALGAVRSCSASLQAEFRGVAASLAPRPGIVQELKLHYEAVAVADGFEQVAAVAAALAAAAVAVGVLVAAAAGFAAAAGTGAP